MSKGHTVTGRLAGTGAALTVALGFIPAGVTILNATQGSILRYTRDMPDDAGIKTVTVGTTTLITVGGITPFPGSEGEAVAGFTLGADADLNAEDDLIFYEAYDSDLVTQSDTVVQVA